MKCRGISEMRVRGGLQNHIQHKHSKQAPRLITTSTPPPVSWEVGVLQAFLCTVSPAQNQMRCSYGLGEVTSRGAGRVLPQLAAGTWARRLTERLNTWTIVSPPPCHTPLHFPRRPAPGRVPALGANLNPHTRRSAPVRGITTAAAATTITKTTTAALQHQGEWLWRRWRWRWKWKCCR